MDQHVSLQLRPDPAAGGTSYRISSLYFDDPADSHWAESEDGVSYRKKYRIRIYNNTADVIKLEVKYKAYNRILKKSRTISREDAEKLIAGECIEDREESMDNPVTLFNLAMKERLLRPAAIIDYRRDAYIFPAGNVRITFDREIRAGGNAGSFLTGKAACTPLKETDRILEVKYDEMLPGFIGRLLELGNMNQVSYSKYRLGREQLEVQRKCLRRM